VKQVTAAALPGGKQGGRLIGGPCQSDRIQMGPSQKPQPRCPWSNTGFTHWPSYWNGRWSRTAWSYAPRSSGRRSGGPGCTQPGKGPGGGSAFASPAPRPRAAPPRLPAITGFRDQSL